VNNHSCETFEIEAQVSIPSVIKKPPEKLVNIYPWVFNRNKALIFPSVLDDIPVNYLKSLPRFNPNDDVSAEQHIVYFQDYTDDLEIEHDDVIMRMFCHSLEGNCKEFFKTLSIGSISCWSDFHGVFLYQWVDKKSHHCYLIGSIQ